VNAATAAPACLQGTDVKSSGHFVYSTVPDFEHGPALRCTNRTEVTQYLARLGATEQVDETQVGCSGGLPGRTS